MNSKMLPEIQLKKGQQRRVRAGHPWVFSNELDMTPEAKALTPGAIVRFVDAGAELMAALSASIHCWRIDVMSCRAKASHRGVPNPRTLIASVNEYEV